ncbi:MAG TPA: TatD family hydrolase [Candidatus Sulfotelmatobacter sp.]|jgi:TatD DNase family protein|nr:TatD family hydrolase [Candidatus Sulfotelmatobacter sp.]
MLIDSHCHLDFPDFQPDLDDILARARDAGVAKMLTISTRLSTFDRVLAVAERYDNVYCTVGIHPHEAESESTDVANLVERTKHPKVVGIGETGLDYFYDKSPRRAQRANFRTHIAAARETGLPVIVHTRDADSDTAIVLAAEMSMGGFTGLLHCFSSGRQLAERALKNGFYISLSGIITFNKSDELRAIVADLPLDRVLVETDAPYLAPIPHRGKRNEPSFVTHTAGKLAEVLKVTPEALAEATNENFHRLFAKVPHGKVSP